MSIIIKQRCELVENAEILEKIIKPIEGIEFIDEYVCCTDCYYFRLYNQSLPYCEFENKCDITDCEDSKERRYRPFYDEKGEW